MTAAFINFEFADRFCIIPHIALLRVGFKALTPIVHEETVT